MSIISLPLKPKYSEIGKNQGKFEINDCYPGYGTTLGNALRRVLLSSLEGAAITAVKIKGVSHEFATIPGVMEDVVHIILNLKKVRFKMYGNETIKVSVKFKGAGEVKAKDIKCTSDIEVVNPDQIIANVTDKKSELDIELEIAKGLGYVPVEQQKRDSKEIGVIAIDAIYTPIVRVNYKIEDMRVGKRTDYNKITLEIVTDGSITPLEAFSKSVGILVEQFSALTEIGKGEQSATEIEEVEVAQIEEEVKQGEPEKEAVDPMKIKVSELKGLSSRTVNTLEENKLVKVKDIAGKTEEDLMALEGMGKKGIKEIKKAIGEFGATLKQ